MTSNRLITLGVWTFIVLVLVVSWANTGDPDFGLLKFASAAAFIGTVSYKIWDAWLWRAPLFQKMPQVPVNVRGTWKGTLNSSWIDEHGEGTGPKDVYLVVRQTSTSLEFALLTRESRSDSALAGFKDAGSTPTMYYLYFNTPKNSHQEHSRMHYGSTILEISGKPARRFEGWYWTDRDSKGMLEFTSHSTKLADDYEEAASLFRTELGA